MKRPSASLWIAFFLTISCAGADINLTCADPLGSDAQTVQVYGLSCFQPSFSGCFEFRLDGTSVYFQSVYITDASEAPEIVDAGEVRCLRDVVSRPEGGWQYVVAVKRNHGYVVRMNDGSLGRIFIDSWETSGNEVTKVNYTRQYPY